MIYLITEGSYSDYGVRAIVEAENLTEDHIKLAKFIASTLYAAEWEVEKELFIEWAVAKGYAEEEMQRKEHVIPGNSPSTFVANAPWDMFRQFREETDFFFFSRNDDIMRYVLETMGCTLICYEEINYDW